LPGWANEGSRSGQAPVLDRLVRSGLVFAEPANQGFLYRLNREHLLAAAVLSACGIRADLLDRLATETQRLMPPPVHASVFGSFARGQADVDSDVDVLLLASNEHDVLAWNAQIDVLVERVERWTDNRCSCVVFSVDRARDLVVQREPVVQNWITDGLLLMGDPLVQFIAASDTERPRSRSTAR
jgi:predicted nucleotidyltransferase